VQRFQAIDDLEDAVNERLSFAIGQRSQRRRAAKMFVTVRITAGATKRALLGDFD